MNSDHIPLTEPFGINKTNALIYSSFVLAGIVTTLLGPLLPLLIARWTLTDERAGVFFTFQFCGNLVGIASLGYLLSRRGYGRTFVVGFTAIALGIAGLGSRNGCCSLIGLTDLRFCYLELRGFQRLWRLSSRRRTSNLPHMRILNRKRPQSAAAVARVLSLRWAAFSFCTSARKAASAAGPHHLRNVWERLPGIYGNSPRCFFGWDCWRAARLLPRFFAMFLKEVCLPPG